MRNGNLSQEVYKWDETTHLGGTNIDWRDVNSLYIYKLLEDTFNMASTYEELSMWFEKYTEHLKFTEDYRGRLPKQLSRFTGYKPPGDELPYKPLPFPPFSWLRYIPMKLEVCIFTWIGSFGGILLIEAIMTTSTAFHEVYNAPIIVTSFGASAVLLFCAIESPLAQPRNFVLGHFVSALMGTWITRLFVLNPNYHTLLDQGGFHGNTFVNGGISMATAALAQFLIGAVHPP